MPKDNDIDRLIRRSIGQFGGTETTEDIRYVSDKWLEMKKYQYGDFLNSGISLMALFVAIVALLIATRIISSALIAVTVVLSAILYLVFLIVVRNVPKETEKALQTYIELRKGTTAAETS